MLFDAATCPALPCHVFVNRCCSFLGDDQAFFSPRGFDRATVGVPVNVWYGDHDPMVPPIHGAWLGERLATARHAHARRGPPLARE